MPVSLEWCAGFFEGEGSATVRRHTKRAKQSPAFALQIAQVEKEPLDEFCATIGAGIVRGPYGPYSGNRQPHYQWSVQGKAAIPIAQLLIPLMLAKGRQVEAVLAEYLESIND